MQGAKKLWRFLLILLLTQTLSACGDANFFFFWNTGVVDPAATNGFVGGVVVTNGDPATSANLVAGDMPKGMILMNDGTVRGTPEETGSFDFTVETTHESGATEQNTFSMEVEAPPL
jgi:hypothetical protein